MEGVEETIGKRKDRITNWLKNPYNLILVGILLFAFILRLYYFFLTKTQPLWWDEASYGALAKNFIYHIWDNTPLILGETHIRPPFFPLLWSLLIRVGIGEVGVRFILEFIPSILSVFFVYLVGKELYSKKVGLISAFIFSILWIHLFYTARLLTHVPAMLLLFSSIYLFVKSTKHNFKPKYFFLSLFLLSLSTLMRYPKGLIFFVYLIMLFLHKKFLIKNPKFWIAGILGVFPLLLFFIMNFILYKNIFPALLGGRYININPFGLEVVPFMWGFLNYIPIYLSTFSLFNGTPINFQSLLFSILFIFFIFGIGSALFGILLGYNFILKSNRLKSHIFLVLILIVILSFFVFYLRQGEDRYLFPASISISCFAGLGINYFYNFAKKYNKYLAIILVLVILLIGAYSQIKFADNIIKNKMESFLQIRQGFEWAKDNTPKESIFIGNGIEPYLIYYAEREHLTMPENMSESSEIEKADYLVVHAFTPQTDYINQYLQENQNKWAVTNVFFFDSQQQQPALVIYKRE